MLVLHPPSHRHGGGGGGSLCSPGFAGSATMASREPCDCRSVCQGQAVGCACTCQRRGAIDNSALPWATASLSLPRRTDTRRPAGGTPGPLVGAAQVFTWSPASIITDLPLRPISSGDFGPSYRPRFHPLNLDTWYVFGAWFLGSSPGKRLQGMRVLSGERGFLRQGCRFPTRTRTRGPGAAGEGPYC